MGYTWRSTFDEIEARRRFHFSDAHIPMARETGLNPMMFSRSGTRSLINGVENPLQTVQDEAQAELEVRFFIIAGP